MPVISLTITESEAQDVSGIPNTITVSTNIPAIIFFTLNGENPGYNSSVYVSPIKLPQYLSEFTLKIFATDGNNSSAIFSQTYTADLSSIKNIYSGNARFPQATINDQGITDGNSRFPFGSNGDNDKVTYTGIGNSDNTILNQSKPATISNAFDATGQPTGFSNEVLDPFGKIITDKNVKIMGKNGTTEFIQEQSNNTDKLFNPKALVIYHDADNEDPLTPSIINRSNFSLENPESTKNGILLSAGNLNTPTITGSFIKSHYNPRTGNVTSYYRDSSVNRWIISEWKYTPTAPNTTSISNVVFGRGDGARFVFPWTLWKKRTLM